MGAGYPPLQNGIVFKLMQGRLLDFKGVSWISKGVLRIPLQFQRWCLWMSFHFPRGSPLDFISMSKWGLLLRVIREDVFSISEALLWVIWNILCFKRGPQGIL